MPRFSPYLKLVIPAVMALALAALSIANIASAGAGIARRTENIAGVPMEIFLPENPSNAKLPTVLVVHGFSGNRQLMYGFGYTLARNGYAAALIDFAGHGASLGRLPDSFAGDAQYNKLASNIDTALAWLRQQPFVDASRLAILGHSMGASAVARYGSTHADVPVTIALSLGNFGTALPHDATQPRNLLVMVGANEFAGFVQGSTDALTVAYPDGRPGVTYGDVPTGSARRLVIVPGVEHISILFSADTYREMVQWLDGAFGVPRAAPVAIDARMGWVLLFYAAAILGFYPLAQVLFANRPTGEAAFTLPAWRAIFMTLVGAGLAVLILRTVLVPYQRVPLTVGNYVGAFFLICGGVVGVYKWLKWREKNVPRMLPWRLVWPSLVLMAYGLATFGIIGHLTWDNFALVGDRVWIAGVLFACCLVFFLADEWAVARPNRWARLGLYALTKLIVLAALVVAVFALGAPAFLLLLVPVMIGLFIWHGVYSHWLFGFTRSPLPGALLNAVVFAWVIASTFALVSY